MVLKIRSRQPLPWPGSECRGVASTRLESWMVSLGSAPGPPMSAAIWRRKYEAIIGNHSDEPTIHTPMSGTSSSNNRGSVPSTSSTRSYRYNPSLFHLNGRNGETCDQTICGRQSQNIQNTWLGPLSSAPSQRQDLWISKGSNYKGCVY